MTHLLTEGWKAAIVGWIAFNQAQGNSPATCRTRREHLQRLARTIGVVDPWLVDAEQLVTWFAAQPWATETKRAHRTTLRGFYGWAVAQGHVATSPALALPRIRPATPNPQPAPDSVYLPALGAATARERLMLRLAAEHGMRRAEIAVVHSRDLVEDLTGWSLVVHGKGGKDRVVPLLDDVAALLRALPAGWAFPGDDGGHLSPRWVGRLLNRLLAGDWTMHKLRHRAATRWWDASEHDLFVVQSLLGHASPATTRVYVAIEDQRLRATVRAAA